MATRKTTPKQAKASAKAKTPKKPKAKKGIRYEKFGSNGVNDI